MKKKKQISERLPASTFIVLSGLISAIASGAGALAISLAFEYVSFNISWYIFVTIAWLPMIFIVLWQSFLLKYQFGWSATQWLEFRL